MAILEAETEFKPVLEQETKSDDNLKVGLFIADEKGVTQDEHGRSLWDEYFAEQEIIDELFREAPESSFLVSSGIWDRSEDFLKGLTFSSLVATDKLMAKSILSIGESIPIISYLSGNHGNDLIDHLDEIVLVRLHLQLPRGENQMHLPTFGDNWKVIEKSKTSRSVIRMIGAGSFMHAPTSITRMKRSK